MQTVSRCLATAPPVAATPELLAEHLPTVPPKDPSKCSSGPSEQYPRTSRPTESQWLWWDRRDHTLPWRATKLYRDAAIAGILGDTDERLNKLKDASAEEYHFNRQGTIYRLLDHGTERERAEEIVDEILVDLKVRTSMDHLLASSARERAELIWSISGLAAFALAGGWHSCTGLG